MRIFVKFFLIVATASVMIFSYKFVIVSDGVKTALSYSNLHFNEYDAAKKNEVISDVEKIYTYRAFGGSFIFRNQIQRSFAGKHPPGRTSPRGVRALRAG